MRVILGIDPGSRKTGFGVIRVTSGRPVYVTSGIVRLPDVPFPERLGIIFSSLADIILSHAPGEVAVEEVFMSRNAASALKLGQARGAAIAACVNQSLPVSEYTARQIKQAVVGTGAAAKAQVQFMVQTLLGLPEAPMEDAADALACALCHAHFGGGLAAYGAVLRQRRGRLA